MIRMETCTNGTNGCMANGTSNELSKPTKGRTEHNTVQTNGSGVTKRPKYDRDAFLKEVFDVMLKDAVIDGTNPSNKVVEFVHPQDLLKKLDLDLHDLGESDERLLQLCRETIQYSVKSGHPHFFNQLWAGLDAYGLAGAWITECVNTSAYTFEVAPVFTMMEDVVMKKLREFVGYKGGDGIFTPGGSVANIYGLNVGRYHQFPEVKTEGMHVLPKLVIFTSEQSHYSMKKGAALLGLGVNNVWMVECDSMGKMIPAQLEIRIEEAKKKGYHPYLVNATSGTTIAGAFDPLEEIADISERNKMWMHVDACWGGGALMSTKHKVLLKGLERADSVAWDPHKMMGTPLQCAVFLTKHENLLQECHSANARYLFQQDKFYDVSFDTGDKSVQCGRKVDVFKLWFMWKARGHTGFQSRIDNAFENSKYLAKKIQATDGFRLVLGEPECTNVCFWYIPPSLRNLPETEEWWKSLEKVAPKIKERMVKAGTMLIGYNPMGKYVNFFRFVTTNGDYVTKEDMDFVLNEIERLGNDL